MQTPSNDVSVTVDLGTRAYEVRVVSGRPERFGAFVKQAFDTSWAGKSCRSALIVTDANVRPLLEPFAASLESVEVGSKVAVVPAGEATKSLEHASTLYDEMIKICADRHTAVVAMGGGVVGDLAGFVAATFARGLPLVMVPTTLLAQVDSSVGGKVGVNHPKAKNIIGAFHQPAAVWSDTETLATLPLRELRCGLAETVKHGLILDLDYFQFQEANAVAILAREPAALRQLVAQSCRIKASVVTRDEREENGLRAALNFGHTIGHAIESVAGYGGEFRHGEAVSVGMIAECRLAERLGWINSNLTDRLAALLTRFGLPTSASGLDPDALIDAMSRDKKNRAGATRFVLPRCLGKVELTDAATLDDIRTVLAGL